jgi:hypothetical protein
MLSVRSAALLVLLIAVSPAEAQRRTTPRKPAPPPPPKQEAAKVTCPETLGVGVKTKASFCFVLAGREPSAGVLVAIPPHTGTATLTFDLHNRHTYSEEEVRAGRGFSSYSAVIGVLGMDGTLLGRGAVQSEFRKASDLYDRITGGAGPGGVKAVAPLGREEVLISVPANVNQVSLLGEVLQGRTSAGPEVATPGRPVAIVSNVRIEYRPAPPPKKKQPE